MMQKKLSTSSWTLRPKARGSGVWLTAFIVPFLFTPTPFATAAVSLDGSNCVLFGGQVKRELAVCVAWEGEGRTLSISLVGRGPNIVERVILRRDGAEPFQTLHLNAQPPIGPSDVGVLYTDMNFDGYGDLAIMRRGHLSVRQPFYYLLYQPKAKRFMRSSVLEQMSNLSFDAKSMRVVSQWRGKTHRFKDSFAWAGNSLRLQVRERRGGAANRCVRIEYVWTGNARTARAPAPCR